RSSGQCRATRRDPRRSRQRSKGLATRFPGKKECKLMASYRLHAAALAAAIVLSAGGAAGQGIPVIDQTAILKHIESIAQLKSQLGALHQQIEQAQQLYGSLNKLTDMADVASVLNDPAIRKALPSDFAAIEGLLKGEGTGVFKDSASKF